MSGLNLEELVKLAVDRGVRVRLVDSRGRRWLARDGQLYALPDLPRDRPLPEQLVRSLCRFYGLSPLDCGLDEGGET